MGQVPSLILLLSISSCAGGPIPKWDGKLWAGDSSRAGLARAQDAEGGFIAAADPRFDDYIAMSYEDFRSFMSTYVEGCAKWKQGVEMMDPAQARETFKLLLEAR